MTDFALVRSGSDRETEVVLKRDAKGKISRIEFAGGLAVSRRSNAPGSGSGVESSDLAREALFDLLQTNLDAIKKVESNALSPTPSRSSGPPGALLCPLSEVRLAILEYLKDEEGREFVPWSIDGNRKATQLLPQRFPHMLRESDPGSIEKTEFVVQLEKILTVVAVLQKESKCGKRLPLCETELLGNASVPKHQNAKQLMFRLCLAVAEPFEPLVGHGKDCHFTSEMRCDLHPDKSAFFVPSEADMPQNYEKPAKDGSVEFRFRLRHGISRFLKVKTELCFVVECTTPGYESISARSSPFQVSARASLGKNRRLGQHERFVANPDPTQDPIEVTLRPPKLTRAR